MNIIKPPLNFPGTALPQVTSQAKKDDDPTASFKDTLKQVMNEINDDQITAKESVQKFLNGEIEDVHEVMIAAEKASVALELTVEVRNKLIDAYTQVMRMSG
ncbi:flagellar hook-basal body complex protein FliE [candidate division KSB1 bacterium]|nr:flagellar hook-basal body complex protein FliE [candidate division KSB1 bacterium]